MFELIITLLGATAAVVLLVRRRWRFADIPTSDAAHVFPGLTEVHGLVEAIGRPMVAASDAAPCVLWEYKVERKEHDSNGTHWRTEENGATAIPFYVRDQSGVVRVALDEKGSIAGAQTIDVQRLSLAAMRPRARVMKKSYTPESPGRVLAGIFGSNLIDEPVAEFHGSWRATERRLKVGDSVFITAHARLTPAGDSVELAPTDANGKRCTFEISVGDERAAIGAYASTPVLAISASAVLVSGALVGRHFGGITGAWAFLGALGGSAAMLWFIGAWNRIRRARQRGEFAWSLIDIACQQRAQTVPFRQSVVGSAMAHEQSLLVAVAGARDLGRTPSSGAAGSVQAADTAALQLIARIEASPNLHTQPNVSQLMTQMQLLTDGVAFGRRFYNDSVERLANRLSQFPGSFVARLARVEPLPLIAPLPLIES